MHFTEIFIRRPALTIVISLVLVIVGIISFMHLPLRWIPNINPPVVSIYTDYPGASASLVESQISTPIEAALAGVDGIETLTSNSKADSSFVTITFKLGRNINAAVEDVRSALQRMNGTLPSDAKTPVIEKADPNNNPIMYLTFFDTKKSAEVTSDYVKQFILPRLQTVEGVATVSLYGESGSAMHIWLDPDKMAAANVTVDDMSRVLTEQNVQVPSGKIRGESRYYSVLTNATLQSANDFNELIIRDDQNQIVRLKDVAQAVMDAESTDNAFRVNGKPAIALGIIPQATANPLDVAKQVKKEFQQLSQSLPKEMQANIIFNQADFIQSSIDHVYQSLLEAIVLVLLVIYAFLGNWRAAFIPIVTIPICLISTFAIMSCLNISVNTITLMALVLAIGLVVDDAIVMLENISRHIEAGMQPFVAAIKGSREIIFPIIAMTITLAAVYAPIAFTSGILSAVFWEFAMTLAGAVIISGVIAVTLTPMMSARMLHTKQSSKYDVFLQRSLQQLQLRYQTLLRKILLHKKRVLMLLAVVGLGGFYLYHTLPSELSPMEDMGEVDVYISAPRDASFQYTDHYVKQLEEIYQKIPDIQTFATEIGFWSPARAMQFIHLAPQETRKQSEAELLAVLDDASNAITGVKVNVSPASSPLSWFSTGDGSSVSMRIMSSVDYKTLHNTMQQLISAAQKTSVFSYIDSGLKWDGEQFEININREKAIDMKIPMTNITSTISTLLAGRQMGHVESNGNLYDIIVQMNKTALMDPTVFSKFYVRNDNHKMVPLEDLISIKETTSPEMLPHYDRLRADTLHASIAPGYTLADAIKTLQTIAQSTLPDNAKFTFEGEAKTYLDSNHKMQMTFFLAMVFIYLVLVAQFESFIDPFIILLTVPFAVVGALFTLKCTGGTLNIYSNIALVTLIGLIAKHGILITEFANQLHEKGSLIEDAVLEAARLRLRPIFMTTAAMMLGALPLAFATGPGAETRHHIGWVVLGGLFFGTFFSLIIVPIAYTVLKNLAVRFASRLHRSSSFESEGV